MSDKERLEDAKKWLGQMRLMLSTKTDKDEIAYVQSKIDLFEWVIEQAERVKELEKEKSPDARQVVLEGLYAENKRYREAIDYVMTAEATQYRSLENALEDIKFVINETLESD